MTVVPMKSDAEFEAHNAKATETAAEDLKQFFTHYESLELERADIADIGVDEVLESVLHGL